MHFFRLSGFCCLEKFQDESIPAVLAKAVAEFTEIPDVSWLPIRLHLLARDRLEQITQDSQ